MAFFTQHTICHINFSYEEEMGQKMKKYRVSKELKPYVRRVLIRSYYSCKMSKDEEGKIWCQTNASSDTFHKIVQRAKCEKKTKEKGIFQVTSREANNCLLLPALLEAAGVKAYQVIDDRDGTRTIADMRFDEKEKKF